LHGESQQDVACYLAPCAAVPALEPTQIVVIEGFIEKAVDDGFALNS
jgi:hypothetical protein